VRMAVSKTNAKPDDTEQLAMGTHIVVGPKGVLFFLCSLIAAAECLQPPMHPCGFIVFFIRYGC
jgi:hypothetical protein